jgi:hypothetical protein
MSLNVGIVGPSKRSSVLGIAKSRTGSVWRIWWIVQFQYRFFGQKTPGQQARHEQGHCHDVRSKHQAKAQVFSCEQPQVSLPIFPNNNAGSLFDLSLIFSAET